jgi:adenosylmethionine-8-amino-7-oxononanoate aminotransferase
VNEKLKEWDKRYIWHPFTQMQEYSREEIVVIEEGEGVILKDIDGNEYIDGVSSLWTNVHGHRKKQLDEALKKQIDKIAHSTLLGISNVPAIRLAKRLVEITPSGLEKVFYSDNGATAVEIAIKMAFQYQKQAKDGNPKKEKFISLKNAYHGDTIGAVSVGGIELFHSIYEPLLFKTYKAEAPYCYRCAFKKEYPSCNMECVAALEELMYQHCQEVTAFIIEPLVQGAAGIIVQPPGYLKKVRELCTKYDILMIADEVAVGFGKTGKMFACEHEDVNPDIMALGKGITGGYMPLAATLTTEKIYKAFLGEYHELKTFYHGHTYTGNPLACSVAIANLDVFEKEKVIETIKPKIKHLEGLLKEFRDLEHVGDIRQCGFMVGIELVKNKDTKEPYPIADRIGYKVILEARKHGVIIRPLGDVIVLMPPLSITLDQLTKLCEVTYYSIKKITQGAN